eukprot:gene7180-286_t
MTFQLSDSEIKHMFARLDTDCSGQISLAELHAAAREGRLGLVKTDTLCVELMSAADTNGDQHISFDEFQLVTAADTNGDEHISFKEFQVFVRHREKFLTNLFQEIDGQGEKDGHITAKELQLYISGVLGKAVSLEEADRLLEQLDTDKSGTVEYEELLRGTPVYRLATLPTYDLQDLTVRHHFLTIFLTLDLASRKPQVPTPAYITVLSGLISGAVTATVVFPLDVQRQPVTRPPCPILCRCRDSHCGFLPLMYNASLSQGPPCPLLCRCAVTATVVCPLDVMKTRLQVQNTLAVAEGGGLLGVLRTIVKTDGLKGLYKGLSPTLMAMLPNWAVYFTTYDTLKTTLHKKFGVLKTRIKTQDLGCVAAKMNRAPYTGAVNALYRIAAEEGVAGLYSGIIPSLFGVVHVAIQFPLYEYLKASIAETNIAEMKYEVGVEDLQALDLVSASGFSKLVSSTITYPHEIVRAQMYTP